ELCRTLPGLIFDDRKAEDCDPDGEDDCADALRYGLMSRPAPKTTILAANPPSDFEARAMLKLIETRRRRVGYIGTSKRLWSCTGGDDDDPPPWVHPVTPPAPRGPAPRRLTDPGCRRGKGPQACGLGRANCRRAVSRADWHEARGRVRTTRLEPAALRTMGS